MPAFSLPVDPSDFVHDPSRVLQLLEALEAAERSNREKSRFLATASHDLRQLFQRLSPSQQEQAVAAMSRLLCKLESRAIEPAPVDFKGDGRLMPIGSQTEIDLTRQKVADITGGPKAHATRVLLVEDDRAVRDATRMLLRTDGYDVAVAGSLSEALVQAARQPSIQLLITDYHLDNNETGLQVIIAVRQRLARELKAILMTGDTSTAGRAFEVR